MAPGVLALVLAAAVSSSKLGVVVAGDLGAPAAPAAQVMAACPRLVVFPLDAANRALVAEQIVTYRQACSGGTVVVQVGGRGLPVSAATAAALWFTSWLALVQGLGVGVDAVEGPWDVTGTAEDVAAFWGEFALDVNGSGFVPIVGAFPPGLPALVGTADDAFCAPVARVRTAGVSRFGVSFHVRATAAGTPTDPALAFQRVATDCNLAGVPLFVTEAVPLAGTWSQADVTWLGWFAGQVAASEVVGVAAFALGVAGGLDLSAVATPFVALLNGDGSGGDGGAGGANGGGSVGPNPGTTDPLSPTSPSTKQGCATAGADPSWLALALLVSMLARRSR